MQLQYFDWCDPLDLARNLGGGPMALLHSSAQTSYSGRLSLLGANLVESVDIEDFATLMSVLGESRSGVSENTVLPRTARDCTLQYITERQQRKTVFAASRSRGSGWFGYLGYEMRHDCEHYTPSPPGRVPLPHGRLMRFADVYVFDHEARTLTLWSEHKKTLPPLRALPDTQPPLVTALSSNMSRQEYEGKVAAIIEEIHAGNLYQANLTRKFYGQWERAPEGLALFARLCRMSPAPYSSYLRMEEAEILSSSPELFLRVEADGTVTTRPIKGSAPRGKTPAEDEALKRALEESGKNRAENLMITDLMRSDLARCCTDVEVSGLFDVTAHATIFHMASTVSGTLSPTATLGTLLRATFPPGSMTGAPKIRAVELCNTLEGSERGVYSGAIGWFGGDHSAELSVVIRTLIVQREEFEFQVGGGIVADSTPSGEWRETMDKSLGILKTLDIPREKLEAL